LDGKLIIKVLLHTVSGAASWWNYYTLLPSSHHPVTNILITNILHCLCTYI